MNKFKDIAIKVGQHRHGLVKTALLFAMATLLSGCYLLDSINDFARDGTAPWWCKGTPDLTDPECGPLSLQFDVSLIKAQPYPTLGSVPGATAIANTPADIGYAVALPGAPSTFVPHGPNVLLYAGSSADSRLAGVAWHISGAEPAGFPGDRDVWTETVSGEWWLTAWIVRGYENHPNVFAAAHPCLAPGVTLASTTDACFTASHTVPFEMVVSNDDGYSAPGIDALVEGLYGLPNVVVHVVAPFANQSGSGDQTSPTGNLSASSVVTLSGRPATAISSTDLSAPRNGSGSPADSVLWALFTMKLSPEIVLSGINQGQNMGAVVGVSGTVGAARTARRNGVPAIATSQGFGSPADYPTGAVATLALLEEWRLGHTVNTTTSVLNINIPTCVAGSVRGTVQTVVATDSANYNLQDCTSTATANSVISDIDGFNKGFASVADVGATKPPNWP